mgnify:CR=1 FL=1
MKKKFVLTLIFAIQMVFGVHLQGQTWRTELGFPSSDDRGVAVTSTFDSAYAVAGVRDYGAASELLYVCKLDDLGDTIWTKSFPSPFIETDIEPSDIIQVSDSGFVISIAYSGYVAYHPFRVVKLDMDGAFQWARHYSDSSVNFGAKVMGLAEASNGDICMTGIKTGGSHDSGFSVLRINAQGDSLWRWEKTHFLGTQTSAYDILADHNDDVLAAGAYPFNVPAFRISPMLVKLDAQGSEIWSYSPSSAALQDGRFENVVQLPDSEYVVAGIISAPNTSSSNIVLMEKVDRQGNLVWSKTWALGNWSGLRSVCRGLEADAQGNIYLLLDNPSANVAANLWKLDGQGRLMWGKELIGIDFGKESFDHFSLTYDNQFVITGYSNATDEMVVMKTDTSGPLYSIHRLTGNVYADLNANCIQELGDSGLTAVPVIAKHITSGLEHYGMTDPDGYYSFSVFDTGQYTLRVDPSWSIASYFPTATCSPAVNTLMVTSLTDSIATDFPRALSLATACSLMYVDIAPSLLRRCETNSISVQYGNIGLQTVTNPRVEVDVDNAFVPTSSIPAWDTQLSFGNHLVFLLDTMSFLETSGIQIQTILDPSCSTTVLRQTVCMVAHIYPDSSCIPPSANWDGSSLVTEAVCQGDTNIRLKVENVGANAMAAPGNVIIVEDNILRLSTQVQLPSGDSAVYNFPANGSTWYIEANQSAGHPGNSKPSTFVEGCGTNGQGGYSRGFASNYPQDDEELFISIHCGEVIGSLDPNIKEVFPLGIGPNHLIAGDQKMEYVVHFQNTGNSYAQRVVVIDTLPLELLPGSIQLGPSSHPYTFEMSGSNTAVWIFSPILLPDSATNEADSKGMFKFSIDQVPSLPVGTEIKNAVDIYFDHNPPITTDTAWSTIGELKDFLIARFEPTPEIVQKITVYPNPFSGTSHIDLGEFYKEVRLEVYDIQGRLIHQSYQPYAKEFDFNAEGLRDGVYIYRVITKSEVLGSGRLLLQK